MRNTTSSTTNSENEFLTMRAPCLPSRITRNTTRRGRYHADPLLAQYGMLKVEDLYRQQLRVHAWRFWRGRLPENQAAMLGRIEGVHGYGTRSARGGLYLSTRDHGSVGYRVPKEWATLGEEHRGVASLGAFKRRSREGFLAEYRGFGCRVVGCGVCAWNGGD